MRPSCMRLDANERRDWRIWAGLAAVLIRRARKLYASEPLGVELDNTVYALDSSTIDLCLSLPCQCSSLQRWVRRYLLPGVMQA